MLFYSFQLFRILPFGWAVQIEIPRQLQSAIEFSTIPNFALRLGFANGSASYDNEASGFQLFRILPFGWGISYEIHIWNPTVTVFNYSEFCPSVGMYATTTPSQEFLVFNYSEFCPSVGQQVKTQKHMRRIYPFSTIPNFALRLGMDRTIAAQVNQYHSFQLFRILPFGWGSPRDNNGDFYVDGGTFSTIPNFALRLGLYLHLR